MSKHWFSVLAALALLSSGAVGADARGDAIKAFDTRQDRVALGLLQAAAKAAPDDAELHAYLGRAYTRAAQGEPAVAALTRALELAPDKADIHLHMVSALGQYISQVGMFKKMSLGKQVKEHSERAVALDPSSVRARESLMQFYIQAPGIAGGSMDKAREQAAAVARLDPAEGLRLDAILARADKKPDTEVVAAWEKAIAAPGAPPNTRMQYAFYLQGLEQWDAASAQFEILARTNAGALYQVGRTAAMSGKNLEAGEKALRAYLETGPRAENDPAIEAAHWRLGLVLEKATRRDEARAQYELALKENPDFKQAREALDKLD
ncbi:MAG: tetratricopeptide repeat protein [Gammaproteobacteria bacterium]